MSVVLPYFFFFFAAIRQDEQGKDWVMFVLCPSPCVYEYVCMSVCLCIHVCVYVEYSCLKLILSNSTQLFFLFLQLKINKVFLSDRALCVCACAWIGVELEVCVYVYHCVYVCVQYCCLE